MESSRKQNVKKKGQNDKSNLGKLDKASVLCFS